MMEKEIIAIGRNSLLLKRGKRKFEGEGAERKAEGAERNAEFPVSSEIVIKVGSDTFSFGNYVACRLDDVAVIPDSCTVGGLRESWGELPEEKYRAAAKAAELINWDIEERHCAADGTLLVRNSEISKRCPHCGREYFPRLNPAIVVLVTRGEEALLVHAKNFRKNFMALVAGFVETGESLEECVKREVKEETTLEVDNVRYLGSQSWPFPHQLMMGFTAEYCSGKLKFADGELSSGGFFTRDNPPQLPSPPSLSRQIIDLWLHGKLHSAES